MIRASQNFVGAAAVAGQARDLLATLALVPVIWGSDRGQVAANP
jgi:hypothetical protein